MMAFVLVVVVVVAGVVGSEGNDPSGAGGSSADGSSAAAAEQRCVDLWNEDTDRAEGSRDSPGELVKGPFITAGGDGSPSDVYVAVGSAADFPDKCLITFAQSQRDLAWQFLETGSTEEPTLGHWGYPKTLDGGVSALPDSAKDFNAGVDQDGRISLD